MLAEAEEEGNDSANVQKLQRALAQTNNSLAQANIQLALHLHKRYQAEQQKYHQELDQRQQGLECASIQYTQALQSQSKDISKLASPHEKSIKAFREFYKRKGDQERLAFSNMMVEGARKRVQEAEAELKGFVSDKEEYLQKLLMEIRLAEQACQDVLREGGMREQPNNTTNNKPSAALKSQPAAPAMRPPVPHAKLSSALSAPSAGPMHSRSFKPAASTPLVSKSPVSKSPAPKMLPPPPPPPPPLLPRVTITPAPPQKPIRPAANFKPAKNTLLPQGPARKRTSPPFSIESEDRQQSSLVTSQQQRLQAQIPQQLLVEIDAVQNAQDISAEWMTRKLFKELWPHMHKMLMVCFMGQDEGRVRLIRGSAGFGADAYLELLPKNQSGNSLIRVPICIVGGDFSGTAGHLHSVETQGKGKSEQAILMSLGPRVVSYAKTSAKPMMGWQKAAHAILYTVKLISTETRARNAGILVTPYGLLFVRRTRKQAALISHLYPFANSSGARSFCHPLTAVGWFVAQLLAVNAAEALKPPCISLLD
ncbi:hypothetical protein IWW36_001398 [Coemansia brasiliensis]|uniref:Uncharacterized protein n=1 Tax=Coemansia brasiliensis TaxID=2650707 RepID=A0A9W8I9N9_9FUNG|nr:hypothetical protein IWW36_001398 [Coemansia brasiliensis]